MPEVLTRLGAIARVARALVEVGALAQLAEHALSEMREALGLDVAVLYLPDATGQQRLQAYSSTSAGGPSAPEARQELSFDAEAWRLVVLGGQPLVFTAPATWLVATPFEPAPASWLAMPLVSEQELVGVVMAAAPTPISLDPAGVGMITLLGDLLAAGVANARLRQRILRAEVERERARLGAEVHDGLAQDLALALRELALLEAEPPAEQGRASRARLRAAVESAHRLVRARLEDLEVTVPLGGIQAAVEDLCAKHERGGLAVRLRCGSLPSDVAPETTAVVLRVLGEALANVQTHAAASIAAVDLDAQDGELALVVSDDGLGVSDDALGAGEGHFGITIMRARARSVDGSLTIEPAAPHGTRLTLRVPLS